MKCYVRKKKEKIGNCLKYANLKVFNVKEILRISKEMSLKILESCFKINK